jgi:molecular chaperone DnaK
MTKKIKNDERINIDYGIDLGTTNSVIVRMERGVPRIIKSDTLKDTVPSCVHFNRRQHILAGDPAVNSMKSDIFMKNSYIEFKHTMGTGHTCYSTHMKRSFTSEELSAEVLKKLKSIVLDDDNISEIVITVPAQFLAPQNDATIKDPKTVIVHSAAIYASQISAYSPSPDYTGELTIETKQNIKTPK